MIFVSRIDDYRLNIKLLKILVGGVYLKKLEIDLHSFFEVLLGEIVTILKKLLK